MKNKKKGILLATPWVGEFGWELFCWQGYLRYISKDYDETIVMSRPNNGFLYEDFAEFIPFDTPTEVADSWMGRKVTDREILNALKGRKHTKVIKPTNIGFLPAQGGEFRTSDVFRNQQKFIPLKSDSLDKKYDIILHARNKKVGSNRNWSKDKWEKLIDKLKEDGYTMCTIGNHESFNFDGIDDYRLKPIEDTVSLMNRANLIIGQSSGAMHLASLSKLPHLVWSSSHNKLRYQKYWNPFDTPCIFYDDENWNPKVENIYNLVKENKVF